MAIAQQYIAKGLYQYSQLSNLVSVKNYIFLRQNGKKCLLIRFSNDLDYEVNSMTFTVIQLDSSGKVLEKNKVSYSNMRLMPGSNYSSSGIVVNEFCTDFKVVFQSVISGKYKYVVRQGQIMAYYLKEPTDINYGKQSNYPITEMSVKPKRFGKPRLAAFVTIIAAVLMLVLNGYNIYSDCRDYYNNGNSKNKGQHSQSIQSGYDEAMTFADGEYNYTFETMPGGVTYETVYVGDYGFNFEPIPND